MDFLAYLWLAIFVLVALAPGLSQLGAILAERRRRRRFEREMAATAQELADSTARALERSAEAWAERRRRWSALGQP